MLKKLSAKTNFVLIGIVVGLFVGVSIRQALGDSTDTSGTARADNLTVNIAANAENGLAVANGNLLVPNGNIGIGTTTPTTSLDVVGDIKTTGSIKSNNLCIGVTCINETQLQALLAVGGTGTDGTGGTVTPGITTGTGTGDTGGTVPSTVALPSLVVYANGIRLKNGAYVSLLSGDPLQLQLVVSVSSDNPSSCTLNGDSIPMSPSGLGRGNKDSTSSFKKTLTGVTTGSQSFMCTNKAGSATLSFSVMVSDVPPSPVISSVSPTTVAHGGTVVITGSNFDNNSYVSMANLGSNLGSGREAIFPTAYTSTTLTITIPTVESLGGFKKNGVVPFQVAEVYNGDRSSLRFASPVYYGLSLWDK